MNTYIFEGYKVFTSKTNYVNRDDQTTYILMNNFWFDQMKSLDTSSRESKTDRHRNGQKKPKDKTEANNCAKGAPQNNRIELRFSRKLSRP